MHQRRYAKAGSRAPTPDQGERIVLNRALASADVSNSLAAAEKIGGDWGIS